MLIAFRNAFFRLAAVEPLAESPSVMNRLVSSRRSLPLPLAVLAGAAGVIKTALSLARETRDNPLDPRHGRFYGLDESVPNSLPGCWICPFGRSSSR